MEFSCECGYAAYVTASPLQLALIAGALHLEPSCYVCFPDRLNLHALLADVQHRLCVQGSKDILRTVSNGSAHDADLQAVEVSLTRLLHCHGPHWSFFCSKSCWKGPKCSNCRALLCWKASCGEPKLMSLAYSAKPTPSGTCWKLTCLSLQELKQRTEGLEAATGPAGSEFVFDAEQEVHCTVNAAQAYKLGGTSSGPSFHITADTFEQPQRASTVSAAMLSLEPHTNMETDLGSFDACQHRTLLVGA